MNPVDKPMIVRDAATVVLIGDAKGPDPRVLMGQRGAHAAFMPSKFVFPGGAVDPGDFDVPVTMAQAEPTLSRLAEQSDPRLSLALLAAAIRELWEETGQILGHPGSWDAAVPDDWRAFADTGHVASAEGLAFIFRAITPPGRPRRFDARFFLADASRLTTDLDDFSRASEELSHLHWASLRDLKGLDLPFITQVVLSETAARLPDLGAPDTVPFFRNNDEELHFERLGRQSPLDD